ncbi:hypothetical protein JOD82_005234 [Paenibacillus sp. 1182]|nr:hypothetical protein [Paenibacillus sp. 1182]
MPKNRFTGIRVQFTRKTKGDEEDEEIRANVSGRFSHGFRAWSGDRKCATSRCFRGWYRILCGYERQRLQRWNERRAVEDAAARGRRGSCGQHGLRPGRRVQAESKDYPLWLRFAGSHCVHQLWDRDRHY